MISYWPSLAKQRLVDLMTDYLIDQVDEADDSRVNVISLGKYRDSPARAVIVLEVHENDPDNDGWEHNLVTRVVNENAEGRYHDVIGGGRNYWWRRFTIKLTIMMRGIDTADSDEIKGSIISRIEKMVLDNRTLGSLVDEGGEYSLEGRVVRERGEQGGDDRSPIWRHKLWLEFKTLRTNRAPQQ